MNAVETAGGRTGGGKKGVAGEKGHWVKLNAAWAIANSEHQTKSKLASPEANAEN